LEEQIGELVKQRDLSLLKGLEVEAGGVREAESGNL